MTVEVLCNYSVQECLPFISETHDVVTDVVVTVLGSVMVKVSPPSVVIVVGTVTVASGFEVVVIETVTVGRFKNPLQNSEPVSMPLSSSSTNDTTSHSKPSSTPSALTTLNNERPKTNRE